MNQVTRLRAPSLLGIALAVFLAPAAALAEIEVLEIFCARNRRRR